MDEILADGADGKVTARFPITLPKGVLADKITLKVVDVVLGKRRESHLIDAFTPSIQENTTTKLSQALVVVIDLKKVTEQGSYSIGLEAIGLSKPQTFDLQIILPAAKLRSPGTLVIQEVMGLFGLFGSSLQSPLALQETTGRSRLSEVRFAPLPISPDDPAIDGRLAITLPNASVSARGEAKLTYGKTGYFPLGVTKGSVELSAPQLAEALTIQYEIRRRLTGAYIILIILFGLLAGFVVRTVLKRRIELNQARLKAIEFGQRIEAEQERHPDEDFHASLKDTFAKLKEAGSGQDASVIATTVNEANTALTTALNELNERRAVAENKLNELNQLVAVTASLPPAIQKPLTAIEAALEAARAEFRRDNIKGAKTQSETLRAQLASELQPLVSDWRVQLETCLLELSKDDVLLPTSLLAQWKAAVAALKPTIDQIIALPANATVVQISQTLTAVATAQLTAREQIMRLGTGLQATLANVISVLGQVSLPDRPAVEQLRQTILAFNAKGTQRVAQPEQAVADLANDLAELHRAWRTALLNQIPNATDQNKKAVDDLLESRSYEQAARQVVQIIKNTNEGRLLGASVAAGPDLPALASLPALGISPFALPAVVTRMDRVTEAPATLEILRSRTLRQLAQDTVFQTILVSLLLSITGYVLFQEKFVGTVPDWLGIFFWAFGLDITVDALLQAAKGIKTT